MDFIASGRVFSTFSTHVIVCIVDRSSRIMGRFAIFAPLVFWRWKSSAPPVAKYVGFHFTA